MAPHLTLGESVAVNGACLTVVSQDGEAFDFQAGPETLAKTSLGELAVGDRVNLERALRVGDALGGHFVTGHVDCLGRIAERVPSGEWQTVWFEFPAGFDDLLVPKGSVAIAMGQTVIYTQPTPGGWHLLGRTPIHLWCAERSPPAYLAPGDRVQFEAIDATDWTRFDRPPEDW